MPRLTVDLNALDSQVAAGRTVVVYPVWGEDAYRRGQGVLADGSVWLATQLTEVTGPDGMAEFEIPASADIGNGRYVVSVAGGPTWINVLMPDEDVVLTRDLLGGNPPDDPALFRPSDIDATNAPMVGWYLSVAEGDDWTFIPQEQGQPGPQGPQGRYERHIYRVAATAPTAPAGDGTGATPTGWSDTPAATVPGGSKEYISSSTVDPATDSATSWSLPAEFVAGALATRGPAGPPGRHRQHRQVRHHRDCDVYLGRSGHVHRAGWGQGRPRRSGRSGRSGPPREPLGRGHRQPDILHHPQPAGG